LKFIQKKQQNDITKNAKIKKFKIFSDVDDTIKAAGTNIVAGCDTRWTKGSLYAGMPQFYLELSRGKDEIETPEDIGIVSARPAALGNKFPDIEKELHAAAKNSSLDEKWGKIKKILPGEIDDNFHVHTEKRYKDYADTKFKNVKGYVNEEANSDLRVIFIGDNGQGDHLAGVRMLAELPSVVAVLIHNVTAAPLIKVDENEDVYIFQTYPEAAWIAYQEGFITKEGVIRVLESTLKSVQFGQCLECLENHASCDLTKVKPHYYKEDGGCDNLFENIEYVAKKVDFDVELPSLTGAEKDPDGMGFFGFFFKILVPIMILGAFAYGVYTYKIVKHDVQKKNE